jgi:hypothetical protein
VLASRLCFPINGFATGKKLGLAVLAQNVCDDHAPKAANPDRWVTKALLPLPRSEMAWAAEYAGRLHLVGGYAERRANRPRHPLYALAQDATRQRARAFGSG